MLEVSHCGSTNIVSLYDGGSDMGDTLWLLIFYDHLWAAI